MATLGPVLANSLNRVVPIRLRPTITVAALVAIGSNAARSVRRVWLESRCLGRSKSRLVKSEAG